MEFNDDISSVNEYRNRNVSFVIAPVDLHVLKLEHLWPPACIFLTKLVTQKKSIQTLRFR